MAELRIVPLGGLGEVGKNMMCIEYGRNILVIDCGIMFPEADMLGIDYILPDWSYLEDKADLIRAIVVTHGHEDHIGGLPHFLKEFRAPVYATRLTRGLIEVKLKQAHLLDQVSVNTYTPGDVINIGPFKVEPYHVCHSIPDTVGLGITTPAGLIVHSGDFKFDHTPVDGWPTDYGKLADFTGRGVLMLLSDSTNANETGATASEAVLDDAFDKVMRDAPGRVIVATFASLISRVQQVVDVARQRGRKIAVTGRSMIENTKMARELGYLEIPDDMIVDRGQINRVPDDELVILATGSQGEPMAVLGRLAMGRHSLLEVKEGDTVVLSSHTIPGNEELIHRVINRLFQKGADVYYDPLASVHVSGHGGEEDLKLLINMLRPKFFMPIHGELRHLNQHGKIAQELGIPKENIAVVENGYSLTIDDHLEIGERVPGGYVFVDGSQVGDIGPAVMRERDKLASNGFVVAVVRYDRSQGKPIDQPRIDTRGFVFMPESADLMERAKDSVLSAAGVPAGTPANEVEHRVQSFLSKFLYRETRRRPIVIPIVLEV